MLRRLRGTDAEKVEMEVEGVSQGLGPGGLQEEKAGDTSPAAGHAYTTLCGGRKQAIMSQTQLRAISQDALPLRGPACHPNQTQVQTGTALVPGQATVIRNPIDPSLRDN